MSNILPFAAIEFWGLTLVALPTSVALAAVALIGYVFGQRTRQTKQAELDYRRQREVERASRIAWQLEMIANRLRNELAAHHSQVELFKRQLRHAQADGSEKAWRQLCDEAEAVLGPTMQLAQQLSHAYDEIRQQSEALETFTQGRTDPLTGVGNGRALESQLEVLLTSTARGPAEFVVAIVSLDRSASAVSADRPAWQASLLPRLAGVIRSCMRETDFVARFGDEEFVVVMPQTSLAGASVFGDRLRTRVATELDTTVCCGLAVVIPDDDSKTLLARADSALYSAKATGPNRLFLHTGSQIREHRTNRSTARRQEPASVAPAVQKAPFETSPAAGDFGDGEFDGKSPSNTDQLVVSGYLERD
jgi:diguanylate cyclase (GGDEF)-like protein